MKKINEIKTRAELAGILGIDLYELTYVLYKKGVDSYYEEFSIPKKNGSKRTISAPTGKLKYFQERLLSELITAKEDLLKSYDSNSNISHGFEKGRSIISNAKIHKRKKYVLNIDLENFFDSIHFGRVRGYFIKNSYFNLNDEVATLLTQLVCYQGSLPQGAPTSPIISNLICRIMDYRILKISKKYRLDFTRYVDDLTFSTNDSNFELNLQLFLEELIDEIDKSGFSINYEKYRLQYSNSRQVVTGLVVNRKISIKNDYYKVTKAMAHSLYTKGEFRIEGILGSLNQLEGRFSYIDMIEKYNNSIDGQKHKIINLSRREKEYQKFLFYKNFFSNNKAVLITEGKTDQKYIRSALKKYYKSYPELIQKSEDGTFEYFISFFKKSKKMKYFFGFEKDDADTFINIYNTYSDNKNNLIKNYSKYFNGLTKHEPLNPVILLFDNEAEGSTKPLAKFIKQVKLDDAQKSAIQIDTYINLESNLFLQTIPKDSDTHEKEIEGLLGEEIIKTILDGKVFSPNVEDITIQYGKDRLSKYVEENYNELDLSGFLPLLNVISKIVSEYKSSSND